MEKGWRLIRDGAGSVYLYASMARRSWQGRALRWVYCEIPCALSNNTKACSAVLTAVSLFSLVLTIILELILQQHIQVRCISANRSTFQTSSGRSGSRRGQ